MATKKFSAFTAGSTNQVPTDVLVGLDLSLAAASQNTKWTLNNLFSVVTRNITDGALRFGGFAAPAVSGAGEGSIYFDSTSNTFKLSQNAGAYFNVGNITTTGFTTTRIPIASGANTLTDDAGLSYNTTTDFLSIGSATGGGVTFVGSNGNTVSLAAATPSAASYLYYLPAAAPTQGQALIASTVAAQTQLGWATINGGSGAANQVAVWSATNTLSGSSALTFSSGVLAISGATNPGVTATGTGAGAAGFTADQTVSGAASYSFYSLVVPSTAALLQLTTAGYTPANLIKANQLRLLGGAGTVETLFELADASTRFVFGVNNVEAASINATSTLGLVLGVASSLTGRVRMYNSAGATYSQISAGNAVSSLNFIWPVVDPSAGQVLSASAPLGGNVTLSWAAAAGSLTATQIGFGSGANALTGSADFTYTDATGVVDLTKTGLNSSVRFTVANASAGTAAQARFGASADVSGSALIAYSSTFTTSGLRTANSAVLDLDGTTSVILGQTSGSILFGLGTTQYASLTSTQLALTTLPTTGAGLSVAASTVTSGSLVSLSMTGTAAASNTKTALAIASSGANATNGQTVFGSTISVTNTNATSGTNIALQLTASGATTANTALNVTAGAIVQTSSQAAAFVSGPNGATNPTFRLNNSTASAATGIEVASAAAGNGVSIKTISSGSNEDLNLNALGTGTVAIKKGTSGTAAAFLTIGPSGATTAFTTQIYANASAGLGWFSVLRGDSTPCFGASNTQFFVNGTLGIGASALNSSYDTVLRRVTTASLAFGLADAAAPVAQTLSVQNVVAGTTDTAGVNWTCIGSRGTGTGQGGSIIWQVAPASGTGNTQNALINGLVLTGDGRLYGSALHNNTGSLTGTTNQYIASGTYTPTVTAVANCDSVGDLGLCQWIRVGNVVTVSGEITVDPTAATTLTQVGISLPIASNFAGNNQCCGTAAAPVVSGYSGAILGDTTNDRAELNFTTATDVASRTWVWTFTYLVA